ncbi:MAG TPA: hypothetical protein VNJ01_02045 [Bacteriovoracaceae bacterium]|nr:hypothetical protein [Bacteriovoracaceae bacterium]
MKSTLSLLVLIAVLQPSLGYSQGCEEEEVPTPPSLKCENAVESLAYRTGYDGSISVVYKSKNTNTFSSVASRLLKVEFADAMKGQLLTKIPAGARGCIQKASVNGIALLSCTLGVKTTSVEIVDGTTSYAWTKEPAVALDIKTVREESARGPQDQIHFSFKFYKYGTFETTFDSSECK